MVRSGCRRGFKNSTRLSTVQNIEGNRRSGRLLITAIVVIDCLMGIGFIVYR